MQYKLQSCHSARSANHFRIYIEFKTLMLNAQTLLCAYFIVVIGGTQFFYKVKIHSPRGKQSCGYNPHSSARFPWPETSRCAGTTRGTCCLVSGDTPPDVSGWRWAPIAWLLGGCLCCGQRSPSQCSTGKDGKEEGKRQSMTANRAYKPHGLSAKRGAFHSHVRRHHNFETLSCHICRSEGHYMG